MLRSAPGGAAVAADARTNSGPLVRSGSMPIRGIDPMGPQFREMLQSWVGGGQPYYRPLPDTRG